MDKVKLEFKAPSNTKIEYNGVIIEVNPFLTAAKQAFLINNYLTEYFEGLDDIIEGDQYHFVSAEYTLKNYILQLNTNVDTEELDNDIYMDTVLWDKITTEIKNYEDFRQTLETVVSDRKVKMTLDRTLGEVLSKLVLKGYEALDKLSNITPEELNQIQQKSLELVERLEKSSLIGESIANKALKPAPKQPRKKVQK